MTKILTRRQKLFYETVMGIEPRWEQIEFSWTDISNKPWVQIKMRRANAEFAYWCIIEGEDFPDYEEFITYDKPTDTYLRKGNIAVNTATMREYDIFPRIAEVSH